MASPVNANISINMETAKAQAQLKALQGQVTALNASMAASAGAKGFQFAGLGKAQQQITQITSATSNLNKQLLSGNRGFISSYKGITNSFKSGSVEMALAQKNVAALNAQYKLLGATAATATTAIRSVGAASAMSGAQFSLMQGQMSIALQSLNQMGTAAQTWGKNMQWAGRQLMVGFTVPLTIFAALAVKSFQDVEKELVNLRKVYGDFGTSAKEVEDVEKAIISLSKEMTSLGFTAKETIGVAAEAAAIGYVGDELVKVTKDVTEFAALGGMAQTEALNALVSINTAFDVSVDKLSQSVDFLNAVENQTILSMQDMAEAVPITAAAIQGLGGDIKDLAVFMTAMREGGINANEAANSLKTSLARLITPTKQATETATAFGISIDNIVNSNEGDLMGMVQSLGTAMKSLTDLQQQQLLSDLFGKRQFARMGALFNNLADGASQANKAIGLTALSVEDLAIISDKELGALKESGVMQLTKQMESLKLAMAPIGEMVANFLLPILSFGEKMLSAFNGLDEGVKKAIGAVVLVVGLAIPAFAMFLGLVGNLVGSITNFIAAVLRFIFAQNTATGAVTLYNTELTEEIALSNAVTAANNAVTVSIQQQTTALNGLIAQYQRLAATRMSGGQAAPPLRMATGGKVPGTGNTDKIPALLTPGEYVINKKQSQKHSGFLSALNNGSVRGFSTGFTGDKPTLGHPPAGKFIVQSSEAPIDMSVNLDISDKELKKSASVVNNMIDTSVKSGFGEQRATDLMVEAAAEAGVVFGQTGSAALKNGIAESLKKWGYSGHGGKGAFNATGTQNSHLAEVEGEGHDFDTLDVDKFNKTSAPGQALTEFKKAGGFTKSKISGTLTDLTDFTSHLPTGSNQGSRQDTPLNAESWHAAWTVNEQKTKAAFRDQAKALLDAKKITDQEYLEILASVEQSYDTVESDLARLKADMSQGPGGKTMTEGEMGGLVQTKMRESGGEKLVDTLTQGGEGGRMVLDVPEEIKANAEKRAAIEKKLDILRAENLEADKKRIASLEAEANALEKEGYHIEKYDGKESRSEPGSGSEKKQVRVDRSVSGRSVSGMPEGYEFVRRNSKFEVRTSKTDDGGDEPVTGHEMTRRYNKGSETGAMFYQNAGKDAVKAAKDAEAELRRIAKINKLVFEDIEQTARQAGVSIPEALAEGIRQNTSKPEMAAREVAGSIPDVMNSEIGAASPAKATEQVGKNIDEGLAQGILNNADDPVVAAKQVGEQMAFAFDESFDGNAVGRDAVQETEQGVRTGGTGIGTGGIGTGTGGTGTGKGKKDPGVAPPNKRRMEGSQMAQMGIGMGISALSSLPMMTGQDNIMGVSSEFTMGLGMATGQIASFSSMLPVGGVAVAGLAAAVGLTAFAFKALQSNLEEASDEAAKLGASLGGAADSAATMSKVFGKATAIQNQNNIKLTNDEQEIAGEFAAQLGSDEGQELIKSIKESSGEDRVNLMADRIESAVINGMIESDQAGTFAKVLAEEVKDSTLAQKVMDRNAEQAKLGNRTERAKAAAEKRDREINSNKDIGKSGLVGQATTMAASAQALKDWTTVAAVAKDEYAEGILSYGEYIDALNQATVAQRDYSVMLQNSVELGDNAYITRRSIDNALRDSGIDDATREAASNEFKDAITSGFHDEGYSVDDTAIGGYVDEQIANLDSKFEEWWGVTPFSRSDRHGPEGSTHRQNNVIPSDSWLGTIAQSGKYDGSNNVSQREVTEAEAQAKAMYLELIAITEDEMEARKLTLALLDESNEISRVYNHVLDETKDMGASLNASLSAMQQGSGMFGSDKEMMNSYATGFVGKSNAKNYAALQQDGQTVEQQKNQLRWSTANATFFNKNAGPAAGPRQAREAQAIGGGFGEGDEADKFRDQYSNAMGSIADLIGPELQDKLTPFVAAGIEAGMVDGGTEGITELDRLLGGDAEARKKYIDVDLEDGSLNEIQEMVDAIKYIKTIPPDIMVQFGIDILNPDHMKMLQDKDAVDRLISIGKMMESLPEEERSFASKFAFDIEDPDGKPITTAEFLNGWREVRKELADLDGASAEVTMTAMIDILTKVNDQPVTPEQAEAAMAKLVKKYGVGTIRNLPPITLATVLDIEIDTALAVEKLQKASTTMQHGTSGLVALDEQIAALKALGDNSVAENLAPKAFNGSPSDGGGGGGGGDEGNWYKDLFETEDKKKDALEHRKKLLEDNKKIAKENSRLNQEVIDALVADEDAYDDYMADVKKKGKAKANKDLNKAYFGNMKKDEREQTQEMKAQKDREDLVDLSDLNYFTKEQIKADAELLELYEKGREERKFAVEEAEKRAKIETTALDRYEREVELQRQLRDYESQRLDYAIQRAEYSAENDFFEDKGTMTLKGGAEVAVNRASLSQRQAEIAAEIKVATMEHIDPIKDKIEAEKRLIKELEREYVINEKNIEDAKVRADAQRRIVEDMQRALEIRQREGAVLSHDLQLMGYMEEDINEAYDKRMEALDKTLSINQQIAQSQQQQLGLASALSRGDVSAAASAAQQMQQGAMENAANQFKSQLETSRDSQINSLTGADSGMTKDQITESQRQLEEDSYYTNLQIRDIEDEIWGINRNIRDEQDIIDGYKDSIKENNRTIKDLEWDIYLAEQAQLTTLQDEQTENNKLLAQADAAQTYAGNTLKIQKTRWDRESKILDAEQQLNIAGLEILDEQGIAINKNTGEMVEFGKAAAAAYKAIKNGNFDYKPKKKAKYAEQRKKATKDLQEKLKKEYNELTDKMTSMLSVPLDLSAVAIPDISTASLMSTGSSITPPSFNIPGSAVGAKAFSGIIGNITNNYMNNNVNINAQGASAVEVVDIVIRQLAIEKFKNIGGAG